MRTSHVHSRALLHSLPVSFTAQIQLSFHQRRTLSLRGPVLLLSKHVSDTPDQASKLLVLSATARPLARGNRKALLNSLRLSFQDCQFRDQFLKAANIAIERARGGMDRYAICHELGRGASGVVYLVKRRSDMQNFAMKVIPKAEALLSDYRTQNLVSERAALVKAAERGSAFIVRLVDAFESGAYLCFVTELAEHGDLKAVLNGLPNGRFSEAVARRLFAEMVLALEESHRMGYLFRDLKLGNMLLNLNGHLKLADFGVAKKMEVEYESSSLPNEFGSEVTDGDDESFRLVGRTRTFVGTRRYMSPEQFNGVTRRKEGYGAPADVWALGVSLYILLSGDYPFGKNVASKDTMAMLDAITNEELRFPPWMGEEATDLVSGMLERDSLERMELKAVKNHPWMRNVNWGLVYQIAESNIPEDIVLDELKEVGVMSYEDVTDTSNDCMRVDKIASFAGQEVSRKNLKRVLSLKDGLTNIEMLGFRYHCSPRYSEKASCVN